ncbi:hypothetical protein BOTBODRAFT_28087 [Botryobasidium botryosum FD-172 SS1]|uniref:Uncharacterized protein n=1 Tax=Botryobasidium botryosum (strain FD-172 SS1) TaxID=930990 RepID=A0A067N5U8_BOTB1|nr:hypothetical protein BOTBODRAFT_28087 [Botryobasidium botryosum FD-172 SS1]
MSPRRSNSVSHRGFLLRSDAFVSQVWSGARSVTNALELLWKIASEGMLLALSTVSRSSTSPLDCVVSLLGCAIARWRGTPGQKARCGNQRGFIKARRGDLERAMLLVYLSAVLLAAPFAL